MPGSNAYTSLEALLLFQNLSTHGVDLSIFSKVSGELNSNPLITRNSQYDPQRLTPDALCDFFLRIWKDEARKDVKTNGDNDGPNGVAQLPRKRKAPSPSLPSLQDVAQNLDTLPKVVLRLYSRYREEAVSEIRETERKHEKLQQELAAIKRGDLDAKLQKDLDERTKKQSLDLNRPSDPRALATIANLKASDLKPELASARSPTPSGSTVQIPRAVPLPATASVANRATSQGSPGPQGTPTYRGGPTGIPHQPYAPRLSTDRSASPLNPQPQAARPSTGQIYGPHGGVPVKRVGNGPTTTLPGRYAPGPYEAHTSPSPGPTAVATPPTYSGSPRPNPPPQYPNSPYPSQRGGVMLQPFQVSPQVPAPLHQQQLASQQPAGPSPPKPSPIPRPPASVANSVPSTPQPQALRPGISPVALDIARQLSSTSLRTLSKRPTARRRLSETKWIDSPTVSEPQSPVRPQSRSVSPISDRERSPEPAPKGRGRRKKVIASKETANDMPAPSTRSGRIRRPRGNSTASSVADSSTRAATRSQSVVSRASVDNDTGVKHPELEPSTPADSADMGSAVEETPLPGKAANTRRSTRGKRKRSVAATSEGSDAEETKVEEPSAEEEPLPPQPVQRETILAVRGFKHLTTAVMNEINAHSRASLFAMPVRDRDAQGYSTFIRRPADLKTIRAAINQGTRAVNAAVSASDAAASSSSSTFLPWSEDLVPPRGIVNSAQLERELMRMFANAVMFNPGEEGVVTDTREMFESVEGTLVVFRGAEQTSEANAARRRAESEMSREVDEEHTPATTNKRRKLG